MELRSGSKEEIKDEIVAEIAEIEKKAKIFFSSESWRNMLTFLVFVVLACCFWLLQYYQKYHHDEFVSPATEDFIEIPVDSSLLR
ncbi:hypothetical protein AGMMS49525_13690 [Bacteroidia bacterium]|nr:hypothetical protein AGMMS49525_13690 [Bacteroidia bacterium]